MQVLWLHIKTQTLRDDKVCDECLRNWAAQMSQFMDKWTSHHMLPVWLKTVTRHLSVRQAKWNDIKKTAL